VPASARGRIESVDRVQHAGLSTLLATRLTPENRILSDDATPRKGLELEVADFGPIAEATVELRPLTVFIGPSNTGKSWLAMLIYALHRFMGGALGTGTRRLVLPGRMFDTRTKFASDEAVHRAIDELVKALYRRGAPPGEEIPLANAVAEEMRLALARHRSRRGRFGPVRAGNRQRPFRPFDSGWRDGPCRRRAPSHRRPAR